MDSSSARKIDANIERASSELNRCRQEIARRLVGQEGMVDGMLTGLIAGGHVLLEGVPGLAKTLAVKTLSEVLDASFKRLQFTPDLLPADLVGTMIYRQQTGEFVARKGPIFANIILAEEINRAPAKVQSALLEAMEERHVTLGDETHYLPKPFFVLATQNPIESEGTYPLPEAQPDRFMMKLRIDYPDPQDELAILRRMGVEQKVFVQKTLTPGILNTIKETAAAVKVDERIEEYIVSIVTASRQKDPAHYPYSRYIEFGASTRATIFLYRAAKVHALFAGRSYVLPEDVKAKVYDVLRHRIIPSYEAESEELLPENIIDMILRAVPVP